MSKFALVIVLDAENETDAWEDLSDRCGASLEFVGGPWPVEDRSEESDYYTEALLAQIPRPS